MFDCIRELFGGLSAYHDRQVRKNSGESISMSQIPIDAEQAAVLEARVSALSATVKALLTTLLLRGLLTKAEIAPLLAEAEALMVQSGSTAGKAELGAIRDDLPAYMREAMGPPPDDEDHDH